MRSNAEPIPCEMFELFWESAHDCYFAADSHTALLVATNPETERTTGYTKSQLVGLALADVLITPAPSLLQNFMLERVDVSSFQNNTFHLLSRDGRIIPVVVYPSGPHLLNGRNLAFFICRDISVAEDQERRLAIKRWALRAYSGAARALSKATSPDTLLAGICQAITLESPFVLATVAFAQQDPGKSVRIATFAGAAASYLDGLSISWDENLPAGQGPTGRAIRTQSVQIMHDAQTAEDFSPWREKALTLGIRSSLTAPFSFGEGNTRGVLLVFSSVPNAFGTVIADTFTHLAEEIGIGLAALHKDQRINEERLQKEIAQRDLAASFSSVVRAITTAMEMRDPYTAGHQRRVAHLASAIAAIMGFQEESLEALHLAALVHDVGKITIPAEILSKPTRLSFGEWAIIQEHPEIGYSILKDVPFRWPIAEMVRQHHERLDGSGYPRQLRGEQILLEAQIIAVADTVEAMASPRPFRPAKGIDAALQEIHRLAGITLNSEATRVCISLFRDHGYTFPDPIQS